MYFAKVIGFYPGDLRWGSDPIRSMFEKDYCISSVKDKSDRDLKPEEHLIDRRCKEQHRQCTLVSLQKCLLSWNELKKFVETFLSHVLFLENVNSNYSLVCFKVPPLNLSGGEIVEVWVSDPSHHRCFKNVIKHFSTDGSIVQMVFIGPESYAAV